MNRKDFEALAAALKGAYPLPENNTPASAWRHAVEAVASACEQQNARFNRAKFLAACGLE